MKSILRILFLLALSCVIGQAQSWTEIDTTHFNQLDGSSVQLTVSEDVANRSIRIRLKKSGGYSGESKTRSMGLSIEEAELFVSKGLDLLEGDGESSSTVATKQGNVLIYQRHNNTEGVYLTVGIHGAADQLGGVRTAIGFHENDYSNLQNLLRNLESSLGKYAASSQDAPQRLDQSQWLLGRWGLILWRGELDPGGLEFRMESDGTISGYIVGPPKQLADMGYQNGMKVLTGIVDTSHQLNPNATWSHQAQAGRKYSPARPGRRESSVWSDGGLIFLDKESQTLKGAPMLHTRNQPSWYTGKFRRPDLRPIEAHLAEYVRSQEARVRQLSQSGSQAERLAAADDIIRDLGQFTDDIPEARQAVAVLSLLRERGEIERGSQLDDAIRTLETTSNSNERSQAWNIMRSEILARGAHLARALAHTEVTDKEAAGLFKFAVDGSKLMDDIRQPLGAPLGTNASRVTENLNLIYGVAGTIRGTKTANGRQFIDGIRNVASRSPGGSGITGILDIPGEIVASLLDVTRGAFDIGTLALIDVGKASRGDREAQRSAIARSREIQGVLSSKSYGDAILGSIKTRLVERIPFVRSVAEWLL